MLHNIFIGLTWLIATLGIGGAAAAVVAAVFLGPAGAIAIVEPILARFLACTFCVIATTFVIATVFAYWVGREGEYDRGYARAIAAIAGEDKDAIARATEKRGVWEQCHARNGQWDQTTGECR
jgi:hypothetical protein